MSYRRFVRTALDRSALMEKNRNAPENNRFCNGFCHDYLPGNRFSGIHTICNQCRSMVAMAERMVRQNQTTEDAVRENPMIVVPEENRLEMRRKCDTCNQHKVGTAFEFNRHTCKSCRSLQSVARSKKQLEGYLHDVEELKTNPPLLENLLLGVPKDCLILIIAHYQIGRKATDRKTTMVNNLVQHFRSLMDPSRCRGCGATVVPPHTTCGGCQQKPPVNRLCERRQSFLDTLDTVFDTLRPLDPDQDVDLYTKEELTLLARKAELKFEQTMKKKDLFGLFNGFLTKRETEREKAKAEEVLRQRQPFDDLVIDEFRIQARASDGYINATQLCKAGGKLFADWNRLENTKSYCEALSEHMGIPTSQLIDTNRGGNNRPQGSWIHPDLAVNLAQWISHLFGIRVSRWVREILTTGHASFDPKSNEELIRLQVELQREQEHRKRIETNHKRLVQRREYHKFQKGSGFYIIRASDDAFKIGFDGVDINERFRAYRTSIPSMKVMYMVFSPDAALIEKCMLSRFRDFRVENNHEFLGGLSLLELTTSVDTLLKYCKIPYEPVEEKEIEAYNDPDTIQT
ncbi:KilA-N domain-containing protein [bacterium]|nr:KilA-N domain-containing protein [bacterium]